MTGIDVSKIKRGDEVTLRVGFVNEALTATDVKLRGTVIDHKPAWREPEGWQEWDGLSVDGKRYVRANDEKHPWWVGIGRGGVPGVVGMRELMQGKTVNRLYITEQAPA